mmetsp:Transcript_21442/g.31744  ORF Transcript_21442/g.31744 Transcript_21442/m.31744 type:complete len:115 (-) Transcript_21442:119-463(-)
MSHIFSLLHIFKQLYRICINEKCLFSSISHLQDQLKGKSPNHKCKTNFQITWQMFVIFRIIEAALFAPENEKSIKTGLLVMSSLQKVDIAHQIPPIELLELKQRRQVQSFLLLL